MREAKPHRIFAHEWRDKNATPFNRFLPLAKQIEGQLSFCQYLGLVMNQLVLLQFASLFYQLVARIIAAYCNVKVRMHREIPNGSKIKQVCVTKKLDGWYLQMTVEDSSVPESTPDTITPTWENSMGLDAVLHGDDYLATRVRFKASIFKIATLKST